MKREGTIGAAALLTLAAVVGVAVHSGSGGADSHTNPPNLAEKPPRSNRQLPQSKNFPWCDDILDRVTSFLEIRPPEEILVPESCEYQQNQPPPWQSADLASQSSQLKFVIALLPHPLHTHLPVLFDEFTLAIQEGAQDEHYDFDSSWLPWEDREHTYQLLGDQDAADQRKDKREGQPGIILFRKNRQAVTEPPATPLSQPPYRDGLIVFVVGEDATHGIHREQFRNAVAWIHAIQPSPKNSSSKQVAILGPAFSGSFPSLLQLLAEPETISGLHLTDPSVCVPLAIYSGSASGSQAAKDFLDKLPKCFKPDAPQVKEPPKPKASPAVAASATTKTASQSPPIADFRSFVQSDDVIMESFCNYMGHIQRPFDFAKLAIISEDETAFGSAYPRSRESTCGSSLNLFYPRDISALRSAYQSKSIFQSGSSTQQDDAQRRNLPTDLADPSGEVHDSIRSYGGNQTPLTQEALLLQIVSALRTFHVRYIVLRASSPLDQIFLADFLRRMYPDGRLVFVSTDLLFARENGTTGLSGTLTLSTYPLAPILRRSTNYRFMPASDRVFSSDTSQGTYIALRMLLNTNGMKPEGQSPAGCAIFANPEEIFVPPIICDPSVDSISPMPDYARPRWVAQDHCEKHDAACFYLGPLPWLSTIGGGQFWPLATLPPPDPPPPCTVPKNARRSQTPELPMEMKLFLGSLLSLAIFYFICCWKGSYTRKPAFRAHFAGPGDIRHNMLIALGSSYLCFMAILAAWSCGVFSWPPYSSRGTGRALAVVFVICLISCAAYIANNFCLQRLATNPGSPISLGWELNRELRGRCIWGSVFIFLTVAAMGCSFLWLIESTLTSHNRSLTYWRSVHLLSGLSPVVPLLAMMAALAVSIWFALHGLALFGPDRPQLPSRHSLRLADPAPPDGLRMFSQEDAGAKAEQLAQCFTLKLAAIRIFLMALVPLTAFLISSGIPVRSLGHKYYALIFLFWLSFCGSRLLAESARLYMLWEELRRLLMYLDKLTLRRTMAALRGFSWGSVWKMSGNVLEVRYKLISRQLECMNHLMADLTPPSEGGLLQGQLSPAGKAILERLKSLRVSGVNFAKWFSGNYQNEDAGDLRKFKEFQGEVAETAGTILSKIVEHVWRTEDRSLILELTSAKEGDDKAPEQPNSPLLPEEPYLRNAEEFVCLAYMGFIQNILGRLRTVVMTIAALFLAMTMAISSYPFDPRQALTGVLVAIFLVAGFLVVMVYAEMHRDATLSQITNTKPGELGVEFWVKIVGFGSAPVIALLARVFPGFTDFVFSWLQPSISSLK